MIITCFANAINLLLQIIMIIDAKTDVTTQHILSPTAHKTLYNIEYSNTMDL